MVHADHQHRAGAVGDSLKDGVCLRSVRIHDDGEILRHDDHLCPPRDQSLRLLRILLEELLCRVAGGLIDLPDVLDEQALRRACVALAGLAGEDQLAVRAGGVFVPRIVRGENAESPPRTWRPHGSVLITGGTGAVGAHAAGWLARNGAEHVILVSRRGLAAPGAAGLRDELAMLGTQVTVAACDVTDKDSVARLLGALPAKHRLTAVVHAAGISGRFAPLTEVGAPEFAEWSPRWPAPSTWTTWLDH